MSNAKTNREQNKLIEQTEGQRNSYILRGQDFTVTTASEGLSKSLPATGQCGDSEREYARLLEEGSATANASELTGKGQPRATETDDAGKPHSA